MDLNKLTTRFLINTVFFLSLSTLHAQVTIGCGEKPNNGCILDLKEKESFSLITSSKGLNLPRVSLVELEPTNPADFSASIGGSGAWDLAEHIGLLVYNVTPRTINEAITVGIYVWNGSKWQKVIYGQ